MSYARGLLNRDPETLNKISRAKNEKVFGIQLLTNNEKDLTDAIQQIEKYKLSDFIDLNLGCSKTKITKFKLGAALLKPTNHDLLKNLIEIGGTTSTLPFSLKIRAGFETKTFPSVIKIAERYNISFITLHARLAVDTYAKEAQKSYWEEAVNESSIPIVANGDIKNLSEAKNIIQTYNVISVAIGRAARINPQIFQNNFKIPPIAVYNKLITYMKEEGCLKLQQVKIHSTGFLKEFSHASDARYEINRLNNAADIIELTRKYLLNL